jgi:methylated-DNA-[protein]-cysteine S-methyltransferase
MAVVGGSCRFGLWFVHVWWSGYNIYQVRFATSGIPGQVPPPFLRFCTGKTEDFSSLSSIATMSSSLYSRIYRTVQDIPYGATATYGEIGQKTGTNPRVVGQAMARNPTPLIVPCHRVVSARGIGGFSPSVEIKEALLLMEKMTVKRMDKMRKY